MNSHHSSIPSHSPRWIHIIHLFLIHSPRWIHIIHLFPHTFTQMNSYHSFIYSIIHSVWIAFFVKYCPLVLLNRAVLSHPGTATTQEWILYSYYCAFFWFQPVHVWKKDGNKGGEQERERGIQRDRDEYSEKSRLILREFGCKIIIVNLSTKPDKCFTSKVSKLSKSLLILLSPDCFFYLSTGGLYGVACCMPLLASNVTKYVLLWIECSVYV